MRKQKFIYLTIIALLFTYRGYSQVHETEIDLLKNYTHFDTCVYDFNNLFNSLKEGDKNYFSLNLKSYGKYDLEVSASNLEFTGTQSLLVSAHGATLFNNDQGVHHWKGNIAGTDKITRLNVYRDELSGYIETDKGFVFFETIKILGQIKLFIYHSSESINEEQTKICGIKEKYSNESNHLNKKDLVYETFSCHIIKIANVASFNLFKQNNYDTLATFNQIRNVFNLADGVYAKYIGLRLKIASEAISLDSLAVYNTSGLLDTRLSGFKTNQTKFTGSILPDIYHLFTEYFQDPNNAVGYGYVGTICATSNNSSNSMQYGDLNNRAIILSHELGHNIGANHSEGEGCGASTGSIMCASVSSLFFGNKEIVAIKQYISNTLKKQVAQSCLTYPVADENIQLDLCDKDSAFLKVSKEADYHLFLYHDEVLIKAFNDKAINLWLKEPGLYKIKYSTDTVSNKVCYHEKEVVAASRNFEVLNTKETGKGSMKYAILNSNGCSGTDTITFKLKDSISIFNITKLLPPIIDNCVVDGTSQKGYKPASSDLPYQPKIILINKLPANTYSKYGLLLSRNTHTIKGLEFKDFEFPITNDIYNFKYTNYSHLQDPENKHASSDVRIFGNKFSNNFRAIYLVYDDTVADNDHTEIGDGNLKNANFFTAAQGSGIRIAYAQSLIINGNYFGMEPQIDTVGNTLNPITINQCHTNINIINNHFGKSQNMGIYTFGSAAKIKNNTFGINPFTNTFLGFTGTGIYVDAWAEQTTTIGGTGLNEGNKFYNQKNGAGFYGSIFSNGIKNLNIVGNKVIKPDTTSIILKFSKAYWPVKWLQLDSCDHNCTNNNSLTISGKLEPKFMNDTFYLHFYSTPANVVKGHEPMGNYLGSKVLISQDTFAASFVHTIPNCKINEGIVFTATSHKTDHTSFISNAVYPKNINDVISKLTDTTLCPTKSLTLTFNTKLSDFKINGNTVGSTYVFNKAGYYNITAKDANGCLISQSRQIDYFPNYLNNSKISGDELYTWQWFDTFHITNIYNLKNWYNFKWVSPCQIYSSSRYAAVVYCNKDTALLSYEVTDINKCTYSIHKSLKHDIVEIEPEDRSSQINIFPNPSNGLFNINMSEAKSMRLYNSVGKLLKTYPAILKNNILDLSQWPSGIYFLNIENYGYYRLVNN